MLPQLAHNPTHAVAEVITPDSGSENPIFIDQEAFNALRDGSGEKVKEFLAENSLPADEVNATAWVRVGDDVFQVYICPDDFGTKVLELEKGERRPGVTDPEILAELKKEEVKREAYRAKMRAKFLSLLLSIQKEFTIPPVIFRLGSE